MFVFLLRSTLATNLVGTIFHVQFLHVCNLDDGIFFSWCLGDFSIYGMFFSCLIILSVFYIGSKSRYYICHIEACSFD